MKALLVARNWTYQDLADRTGIAAGNISNYVNGVTIPGLKAIDNLADKLGVSPSDLIRDDESAPFNLTEELAFDIVERHLSSLTEKSRRLDLLSPILDALRTFRKK